MKNLAINSNKIQFSILIIIVCLVTTGCVKRNTYLDQKPQTNLSVPSTLTDFQAILDAYTFMNCFGPTLGVGSTDLFYVTDQSLSTLSSVYRNIYTWQPDVFQGTPSTDWTGAYSVIERANIVLDGLSNISIDATNRGIYSNVKGQALFFRAFYFYDLAQEFCKPYDSSTARMDLGIVLRMTSDVSVKSVRSTVEQTFSQIIADLQLAINLLPATPEYRSRPSQAAAWAMLAKVDLLMGNYKGAASCASSSLAGFNTLIDFNSSIISPTNRFPFPPYPNNPEISFYAYGGGDAYRLVQTHGSYACIDTTFYNSYDSNDLRKQDFYFERADGSVGFSGSYIGSFYPFNGIATNELYIIRAEAYARQGDFADALSDLNTLLVNRYKTGTYSPYTTINTSDVLTLILRERAKELPFTGQLRWEDLRRLNKDPKYAKTLTRPYNSGFYSLPPNDPRYVMPIPDLEDSLSGLQQNPR